MLVCTEVDPRAKDVCDTGMKRAAGVILHMNDIKNSNNIAAIIALMHSLKLGMLSQNGNLNYRPTALQTLEMYNERPEFFQDLHLKGSSLYETCFAAISKSYIGSAIGHWVDNGESTDFIESIFNRQHINTASEKVFAYFMNAKSTGKKISRKSFFDILFKYHGLWKKGEDSKMCRVTEGEKIDKF